MPAPKKAKAGLTGGGGGGKDKVKGVKKVGRCLVDCCLDRSIDFDLLSHLPIQSTEQKKAKAAAASAPAAAPAPAAPEDPVLKGECRHA